MSSRSASPRRSMVLALAFAVVFAAPPLASSARAFPGGGDEASPQTHPPHPRVPPAAVYLLTALALVVVAGTMAGLTVGLLGMDPIELEVAKEAEEASDERARAAAVWSVTEKHHWLLTTLLLVNAAANEALPLCLNELLPPPAVVLTSVTLVLIFGEILPSAVFTGPRRLRLAAAAVPFVKALMWLTSPASYPLAKTLDWMLGPGRGETRLDRRQIGTLIGLHQRGRAPRPRPHASDGVDSAADADARDAAFAPLLGPAPSSARSSWTSSPDPPSRRAGSLTEDEVTIVRETLKLATKTVSDAMTPASAVRMLSADDVVFDEDTLASTLGMGHSRVPVYRGGDRNNVVGTLMVKKLIVLDPNERRPLRDVPLRTPLLAHPDAGLLETLNAFQVGRSHLAIVTRHARRLARAWRRGEDVPRGSVEVLGIITVEDVLEELLGEEIHDESDYSWEILEGEDRGGGSSSGGSGGAGANANATVNGYHAPDATDAEAAAARRPAVLAAVRKFKLLLSRSRARRLRRDPSVESLPASASSVPTTPSALR